MGVSNSLLCGLILRVNLIAHIRLREVMLLLLILTIMQDLEVLVDLLIVLQS